MEQTCPSCGGAGLVDCPECGSSEAVDCDDCLGTGYVETEDDDDDEDELDEGEVAADWGPSSAVLDDQGLFP